MGIRILSSSVRQLLLKGAQRKWLSLGSVCFLRGCEDGDIQLGYRKKTGTLNFGKINGWT